MKVNFQVFTNYKQNNQAGVFFMSKFAYCKEKNLSTGHIFFEPSYNYYLYVSYKKVTNLCFKSKLTNILLLNL